MSASRSPEYVLHSANSAQRIAEGLRVGFHRFDVDIRRRGSETVVVHGFPLGPFVLDVCGRIFGRAPKPCIRWRWRLPKLCEILADEPPPLLLDLKGHWSAGDLRGLYALLRDARRRRDLIASQNWEALDRYAKIDALQRLAYSADTLEELTRLIGRVELGDERIDAVSLDDRIVQGREERLLRIFDGVAVYVWNISDRERFADLVSLGVDGVVFSDPSWIL